MATETRTKRSPDSRKRFTKLTNDDLYVLAYNGQISGCGLKISRALRAHTPQPLHIQSASDAPANLVDKCEVYSRKGGIH